jgi:hypothetical protein
MSLVAYVSYAIFRLYIKSKSDVFEANQRLALKALSSGMKLVPSWAGDRSDNRIFVDGIQRNAMRNGVPRIFLMGVLCERETFQDLVHYAGAMEAQGSSFIEQQMAVSDRLVEIWRKAPEAIRRECLSS